MKANFVICALAIVLGLTGCAKKISNPIAEKPELKLTGSLEKADETLKADSTKALLRMADIERQHKQRMAQPPLAEKDERMFSFSVKRVYMKTALAMFAQRYKLNIIPDLDVSGKVTVSFSNLSLRQSMEALLKANGYYFTQEGDILRVHNMETRMFEVNYPRFIRSGEGNVETSMNSGSSDAGSNTGTSGGTGTAAAVVTTGSSSGSSSNNSTDSGGSSSSNMSIKSSDSIDFWGELDTNVKALVSKDGTYTINRLSGVISVTDHHSSVVNVAKYLDWIDASIHRQVVVTAQIIEISKSNTDKFAIDWSRVTRKLNVASAVASITPFGIISGTTTPSLTATYENNNKTFKSIIEALKEQGDLKVISNPEVRTINNQPAIIKVGTDRTFFRVESVTNTTSGLASTTSNDIPLNITVGLLMSITPQISANGQVTLDISPVVTSLTGTETSTSGSVAPVLDIKQVSSVVSVKSGQPVVIGGLIQHNTSLNKRKVPMIGDIPILGSLFRGQQDTHRSSELVIFITPYVI